MDAAQFLTEFDLVSDAPNGVAKLRELILVLAMQGRLLPQVPEESASSLLEAVASEKRFIFSSRKFRAPSSLPAVTNQEKSYSIPDNWSWVRFGEIAIHNSGKTLDSRRNSGQPRDYITTSNLYWGRFELDDVKQMLIREEELEKCTASLGDLLICEGGEAGRAAVWTESYDICFQNHIHRARFLGGVNPFFAFRFFEKLKATGEIDTYRKGIGISSLSSKALAMIPFPLPPLEEQLRIVSRVDELMTLCDQLEKLQKERRELQSALRQSTLRAVTRASSEDEVRGLWRGLHANLEILLNDPKDVSFLRKVLLNLAFRGYLIEQNSKDVSADKLLQEIKEERFELIVKKKIKSSATILLPQGEKLPHTIPNSWKWARLSDLVEVGTGATPAKSEPGYYGGNVPWYTSSATNEKFTRVPQKFITERALAETNCRIYPAGSLIIALYGQGKTRGQISELTEDGATNQALAAMVFFKSSLKSKQFIKYYFEKIYDEIRLQAEGGPQPNLNVAKIKQTLVPVPPMEEQQRIVNCLDKLFFECDDVSSRLKLKMSVAEQLTSAAVSALTGSYAKKRGSPMKAPKTDLIAPLRLREIPSKKASAPLATILARHSGGLPARDLWQRFGGDIESFYSQLKAEVEHGWIAEPEVAEMREIKTVSTEA